MLTSVRRSWVNLAGQLGVFDELERAIGCSAEGALYDCYRVGGRCQGVEYAQRVERGVIGVKYQMMNCDGWRNQRDDKGALPVGMTEKKGK